MLYTWNRKMQISINGLKNSSLKGKTFNFRWKLFPYSFIYLCYFHFLNKKLYRIWNSYDIKSCPVKLWKCNISHMFTNKYYLSYLWKCLYIFVINLGQNLFSCILYLFIMKNIRCMENPILAATYCQFSPQFTQISLLVFA